MGVEDYGNADECSTWRQHVEDRLKDDGERMARMEQSLIENTTSTKAIETNTKDLVDAFSNLQAALKVLNWIGKLAKPLGYIVAFAAATLTFYQALKSGHPIPPPK